MFNVQKWALLGFSLCLAALPLIVFYTFAGYVPDGDGKYFYFWVKDFQQSLEMGVAYPRWAFDDFGGLGSAVFTFYSPIYFYVAAIGTFLLGDPWVGMISADVIGALITAISAYFIAQKAGFPALLTLLLVAALTLNPFQLATLLYVQGHPWNFVYGFVLLLFYVFSFVPPGTSRRFGIALILALVVSTHLLTGFMVVIAIGLASLVMVLTRRSGMLGLMDDAFSAALGLLISAVFLLPSVGMMDQMNELGYASDVDWQDGFSFPVFSGIRWFLFQYVIAASIFFGAAYAAVVLLSSKGAYKGSVTLLIIATTAFLLSTELMHPLWAELPMLRKVQYAYRFLSLASIAVALAAVLATQDSYMRMRKGLYFFGLAVVFVYIGLGGAILTKAFVVDATRFGEVVDRDAILFGHRAFLPKTAGKEWKRYLDSGGFERLCEDQGVLCAEEKHGRARTWTIESMHGSSVVLPLFAFPSWQISMDGQVIVSKHDPATGLIAIDVPPKLVKVEAVWVDGQLYTLGKVLSVLGMITLVAVGLGAHIRRARQGVLQNNMLIP